MLLKNRTNRQLIGPFSSNILYFLGISVCHGRRRSAQLMNDPMMFVVQHDRLTMDRLLEVSQDLSKAFCLIGVPGQSIGGLHYGSDPICPACRFVGSQTRQCPRYCRKVCWTEMAQNGTNDHFGQNDPISNRISAFTRPK